MASSVGEFTNIFIKVHVSYNTPTRFSFRLSVTFFIDLIDVTCHQKRKILYNVQKRGALYRTA